MTKLDDEVRRGNRAKEILEDEVFKDAVKQVEDALLFGMKQAGISDEKLRLRLLDRYELLHNLLGLLKSTIETGAFASQQIQEMEKRSLMEKALKAVGWN